MRNMRKIPATRSIPLLCGHLTLVASVCGTEGDIQELDTQVRMLQEAGVLVFESNARAAHFCSQLLK